MSVQASTWAWTVRNLSPHLRLTLLAIADACNADGYGYPGQERLGRILECSDRQVRRNVHSLEERGLLTVMIRPGTGEGRRSNAYQLHLGETGGNRTSRTATGHPEQGGQPDIQDRATGHPGEGQPDIAMSYEPLVEPSAEPSDALCALRAPRGVPETTKPSGFDRFWDAWPAGHRKRGRKTALGAWQSHHLEPMAEMIIADVRRRALHDEQWLRGYAPMPQTYLRGARWEDEYAGPPETGRASPQLSGIAALERFKCQPPIPGSSKP